MVLTKLLLLIFLLIVGCLFAVVLLFRLARASQRLAELQKEMVANDQILHTKMEELQRQRMAIEAAAAAKSEVRSQNDE